MDKKIPSYGLSREIIERSFEIALKLGLATDLT